MKEQYNEPEVEIIRLAARDIISTSEENREDDELPPFVIPT